MPLLQPGPKTNLHSIVDGVVAIVCKEYRDSILTALPELKRAICSNSNLDND